MDFHCMKRKQLQALCKKHKIPANLSNLEMANKLKEFLKEKENPVMKGQEENVSEDESNNVVVNRKVKKVRFSPEHELIEFTRSPERRRRSRRNSVCRRDSNWSVEIVEGDDMNKNTVGRWCRTERTGELKIMEEEVNQKKRGMKAVKCNDGKAIASAVEAFDDDKLEEGDVVESGRVMRSKGKMAAQGVKNASKIESKRVNDDDKSDVKVSDDVNNEKHQDIVDNHRRVTRSRAQKLTAAPAEEEKRGRKLVKNMDKVAAVSAGIVDNGESEGKSATGSDVSMQGRDVLKENLVNKQIAEEHVMAEPQVLLRRSKRKVNTVGDSEMFTNDTNKHENGGIKDLIKTYKLLPSDGSRVDAEVIGSEVNPGGRAALKIEEPIKKVEPRRSNRRKIVIIESGDLRAETENRYPLKCSVPQSDIVPEVSKDDKMVFQPIGVMRRSRRKMLSLKLDSANDTDSAVENIEAGKHLSELCLVEKENYAVLKNTRSRRGTSKCKIGGDSSIHQTNEVTKRKRSHVSGGDVIKNNNDLISGAQSWKGSSSKKVVSASATGKFADEGKQPCRLDNRNMLDSSSHGSSGIGESLFLDVQLPVSKDPESASNLCSKNTISDMELTSIRKTHRKNEEVSTADSGTDIYMNLTNGEELAKSDTNAASKIAQLETDSTVSEDQNCTCNIREVGTGNSLLEFDVQESTEKNTADVGKNDPEAQVYSQMEDTVCDNKIDDQELADGLNVSGKEGSDKTCSSTDSLLLGDQTDVKTDLKIAEIEVDECVQPCPRVVDHHNDLDHLEASSNILDNNNEDASQTAGEVETFVSYESETDYTHSKSTSKLKAPSSGMMHHDNNVAEADEDGCSKDHGNASGHFSEFDMPDLCNGEIDARIASQDRGIFPGECSVMSSDEHCKDFLSVAPNAICTNSADVNLKRSHEDDQMTKGEERDIDQGINSEVGETREGESSKGHKNKCDEDGDFSLANLFNAEGRYGITPQDGEMFSGEHSVKDFDEQGMLHGSPSVAPITTCNSIGVHEANLPAEGEKTYTYKNKQSELTEADENGCLKNTKSSKDEDWEFSVFNLFDGEKSTRIEPQDTGVVSAKYPIKELNEQEMFPYLPGGSTVCVNYNEVTSDRDSSNPQETNPSTPSSVSETQAEQQKSLSAKSNALAITNQRQEAWSNESDLTGNAVRILKSHAERKIDQVAEGLSADEDVNHANCGIDKEDSARLCISDVKHCPISKVAAENLSDMPFQDSVETEQQQDLLARQTESDAGEEATHVEPRQSWAEIELRNLFGTTSDDDAPPELCNTFCQGTEVENMTMSENKSTANNSCSWTKKKGKEMEGDSRNECAETGFDVDIYENELKFLFATPVKIMTPCKIEETYSHDRILNGSVTSNQEYSDAMKKSFATKSTSNEKTQNAGYEVENNLCTGDSLSDNGGDDIFEEINEVESLELLNTSTRVLSGVEYDGCEALEDQLPKNKEECLKETKLITEEGKEEHVIPQAPPSLHDDATEKNIISSSGSPWDLYELESCAHLSGTLCCQNKAHNESEGEMTQSTEAVVELSDADLQKSDVPENSHLLTAGSDDGNILRETSLETSSDPKVEEIGSFQKGVAEKGISPFLCSNASPDCEDSIRESDDQYEAKIWEELHTNSEVAIQKSVTIVYNLCQELDQLPSSDEFERTCKEAKGTGTTTQILYNTDAAAEHESYVFGAVSGLLSSSAMPACLGYHENGDKKLEAGELSDNGGVDTYEKINKVESVELKDTSTAALSKTEYEAKETGTTTQDPNTIVAPAEHGSSLCGAVSSMLSSSEMLLHLRDKNNDVENLSGDDNKENSEKAEDNSTAQMVKFSIQELHFEENVEEDLKNDAHTCSDLPASGYNEILKESDVADTIKEYIDSESSLSVIFENSSASVSCDMLALTDERIACESSAMSKHEDDIAGRLANSKEGDSTPSVDCLETGTKEEDEATLFIGPAQVSGNAVNSPGCVGFLAEVSAVKLESKDGQRSSSKVLLSTKRKNARTILIHGTPGKLLTVADMKENAPSQKSSNIGDVTAVRPAKRRALQDVQWK